jgi:sucrose phosphorylase
MRSHRSLISDASCTVIPHFGSAGFTGSELRANLAMPPHLPAGPGSRVPRVPRVLQVLRSLHYANDVMNSTADASMPTLPSGVMFNAYPDSIGERLADLVALLKRPELEGAFSLLYILPTFFHSDLDRGFSIIDYDINEELVRPEDLADLHNLNIALKLDLVLNHLSVRSPQFQDLIRYGKESKCRDFFIDWNEFWDKEGGAQHSGEIVPDKAYLDKLFMRKPGLPILRVCFPDGTRRSFWNTFYQQVQFQQITAQDFLQITGLTPQEAETIAECVRNATKEKTCLEDIDLGSLSRYRDHVLRIICQKRAYLGQMDLNARSESVWKFYDATLRKLRQYGAKIVRLDAFAYLHKEPGQPNFFNRPGTWEYLSRLKRLADDYELIVIPEIHAEYGSGLHEEIARQGYPIYDFFLPGLVIDALDRGSNAGLLRWIADIRANRLQTINMLGCHDGIPVLDLRGKEISGSYRAGLLEDEQIEATMDRIVSRGGRVKNLFGPDGRKIAYYQINATFFSALGEDQRKLLLARAIQMFMPGTPQVWYLDLFAGKNDYDAADTGGVAAHKEINRTTLSWQAIDERLRLPIVRDQLALIRFRNTSAAFRGEMEVLETEPHRLHVVWQHGTETAVLKADLRDCAFAVYDRLTAEGKPLIAGD